MDKAICLLNYEKSASLEQGGQGGGNREELRGSIWIAGAEAPGKAEPVLEMDELPETGL